MSEISETEIKAMTKEQNYMRGYKDGESDALDKIRAHIERYKLTIDRAISEDELKIEGMKEAYANCIEIIDKYKIESEDKKNE